MKYPTFATSGFSLVFFLLLGGILWFIPVGLCAAEMATVDGWEEGGVFAWVSNTLGPRWGFAAISFGYLQIAIGFIPMLYFVLGALSYILKWPALNEDPITKTIAALIILWALALTQFGGTKYTARIAKVGFLRRYPVTCIYFDRISGYLSATPVAPVAYRNGFEDLLP
ncbi:glutamate/gamma-aminobutyrate antiporter (extreme acid sensitivity protein) [Escherichia coli]|uniref:Glutamate/gamma-aminobutyrate antiporter (Extreme acid sensitivity protein) n=1 Tax=Escherichia coli TaxID=562 RepID=A0A377E4V4_ECOLX|nr:glutamate/gamma-aminobutyrate antiporter (extreme acid sensitivity protein) [Escherichia coli]